jgi:hypothetical protein
MNANAVSRDQICPICGKPNDCVRARSGTLDEPCWCEEVEISADAISRVPEEKRGKSCICHHCAFPAKP